jgi:putative methionine-R-sulfoxide reductase with GAF domain
MYEFFKLVPSESVTPNSDGGFTIAGVSHEEATAFARDCRTDWQGLYVNDQWTMVLEPEQIPRRGAEVRCGCCGDAFTWECTARMEDGSVETAPFSFGEQQWAVGCHGCGADSGFWYEPARQE